MDFFAKNLEWTNDFVEKNISIIEKNYNLYPHRNRWNCDCHVIHDNDYDVEHIDFLFLREKYNQIVRDFCDYKKIKLKHLSDIWYNYYKESQYQEPHIHEGNGYTAVHYLIYDKNYHSKTEFTDKNIICPEVSKGDIIIFPSEYEHYVLPNTSNMPRLTVAFTIVLN
jgi:hypothetical protein